MIIRKNFIFKRILFTVLSIVLLFIFTFTLLAAEYSVTVIDDLDCEVKIEGIPERIISLAPSNTEILFALGLDEEIIGVTTFADYPEEAKLKEKIGSLVDPNIEKIVSLKPDLVLASDVNKIEAINKLKALGITVAGFNPTNINEAIIIIKKIGRLTAKYSEAETIIANMYIELAETKNLVDRYLKDHSKQKVFYEIWSDPLYTAGKGTFIDNLIEIAGGINIGAKAIGSWPQYSLEKLLIENPDVFISSPMSAPGGNTVERVKERPGFSVLKAVKNDRVYLIDSNIVNRPSPRIILGLKTLVKDIFPELAVKLKEIDK
jgi:iron complex transport system substrate-binding protein